MLVVHYLNNSRAHRILWLLEELGLPYEIKTWQRGKGMRAPEGLKSIHPLGKSPILVDGDITIAESGSIFDYVLRAHGKGQLEPQPDTADWRRYIYWMHYAEGSAMPLFVMKLIFSMIPNNAPFFIRPVATMISKGINRTLLDPQIKTHFKFWNDELLREGWFCGGQFSAADIMMSFVVEAASSRIEFNDDATGVRKWLEAIRSRPAYQKALEKGGAYAYASTSV